MIRKNVIPPEIMNNLCNEPLRHAHQRIAFEPQPAPEPEKKSLWGWISGKVERACNKVKGFFEKVAEIVVPITTAISGIAALFSAGIKLRNKFSESRCQDSQIKYRNPHNKYVDVAVVKVRAA